MRRASSPVLALALALVALAWPARGEEPTEMRARVHELLDERYQTELPRIPVSEDSSEKAPAKPSASSAQDKRRPQVSEPTQVVARLLLWCLLFAGALVALLAVVRLIARRKEAASLVEAQADTEDDAALGQPLVPLVGDIDLLAREGRYGEAIHALLGSVLAHFARLGNVTIGPSTTSREVLDAAPLDAPARAALGDLVTTVEVSLFGGLEVGEDDYVRCMSSFRRLEVVLSR